MMTSKRMKAFLLLGVMILGLVLCSCSPVPATKPSETEPPTSRPLIELNPDNSTPKEGTDSFYDDRVLVGLKPGFGGINREIDLADFAEANIILESEITEDTDLTGKIVITSVVDRSYKENPERYNPDTYVQRLCFYLRDKSEENVLELVARMQRIDGVKWAEPDYIYVIEYESVSYSTSDDYWGEQWGLSEDGICIADA